MIKESYGLKNDYKLIVKPKNIGITEDVFDFDGEVYVFRVFSSSLYMTAKHINIGDERLNCIIGFSQPSQVHDFVFNCNFKKGDKFILDTIIEIKRVELFIK